MGVGAGHQTFQPILLRKSVRIEQCDELRVALSQCEVIACGKTQVNIRHTYGNLSYVSRVATESSMLALSTMTMWSGCIVCFLMNSMHLASSVPLFQLTIMTVTHLRPRSCSPVEQEVLRVAICGIGIPLTVWETCLPIYL